ncbi:MAG: hypothetical protein ABJB05_14230 [Parafilimonas sp.]
MKKVLLVLSVLSYCLSGNAQKITKEQAQSICAQEMAAFTKAVSGAYKKGISYDQFQSTLCGKWQPTKEGGNQLLVAYNFLTQGATNDYIIKTYKGTEVAACMKVLSDLHSKGFESDGSELYGGKTGVDNNVYSKTPNCRWYQFWCLVQDFANWVIANWEVILAILTVILNGLP